MSTRPRKFELINCPFCGQQYLPAEIYYPKHFFGKPYGIERDVTGRIVEFEGTSMDLFETFICEQCDKEFRVCAKLTLSAQLIKEEEPFVEEYVSNLDKYQLFNEQQ